MEPEIMVSVICVTYNHENYIKAAIEGFVAQKTDFRFEVLIYDDASTDKTAEIIREYEKKYPNVIKSIYQTENQYSKGIDGAEAFLIPWQKENILHVVKETIIGVIHISCKNKSILWRPIWSIQCVYIELGIGD